MRTFIANHRNFVSWLVIMSVMIAIVITPQLSGLVLNRENIEYNDIGMPCSHASKQYIIDGGGDAAEIFLSDESLKQTLSVPLSDPKQYKDSTLLLDVLSEMTGKTICIPSDFLRNYLSKETYKQYVAPLNLFSGEHDSSYNTVGELLVGLTVYTVEGYVPYDGLHTNKNNIYKHANNLIIVTKNQIMVVPIFDLKPDSNELKESEE